MKLKKISDAAIRSGRASLVTLFALLGLIYAAFLALLFSAWVGFAFFVLMVVGALLVVFGPRLWNKLADYINNRWLP